MKRYVRQIGLIFIDLLGIIITFTSLPLLLRKVQKNEIVVYWKEQYIMLVCIAVIFVVCFKLCGLYDNLWRYASFFEFAQIAVACCIGNVLMYCVCKSFGVCYELGAYVIFGAFYMLFIMGNRWLCYFLRGFLLRYKAGRHFRKAQKPKRVMVVGAGSAADLLIQGCKNDPTHKRKIVVAIDDDKTKRKTKICGVPIEGSIEDVVNLAQDYHIEEVIITMTSVSKERLAEIIEKCSYAKCKINIFMGINKALESGKEMNIRSVRIEDLLGRQEVVWENEKTKFIMNKATVLVTGGGGSIGSEICRQISVMSIKQLIIFDIYENSTYNLQLELKQQGIDDKKIKVVIGSIRDRQRIEEVFEKYRPDMVFHAAAHKHVPLMEDNPEEAIKNNVFGTLNVMECSRAYKVRKFVMVSTDKAVNPTSVMGVTKRIGELMVEAFDKISDETEFVAVRFGNVLGSNGSVIPLFKKQIEEGGPVTVTHPKIIRYFMTIEEAVGLVIQAGGMAKGGEIFVLDMGEPVKILDLAKNLIRLSGFEPDVDIKIVFTGLRPGEKLYEELLMSEEGLLDTKHKKIFIGRPIDFDKNDLQKYLIELRDIVLEEDDELMEQAMKNLVPTFISPEVANAI